MKPTIVSILGRPLAGKDTQAELLKSEFPDAVVLSTGAMIREVKETGPDHRFWPILGPEVAVMDSGVLISEDAINKVFEQVVHEQLEAGKTLIIATAHPRTLHELDSFNAMLRREGLNFIGIHLETSEAHMKEFHKTRNGSNRADDAESVLDTRTAEFENRTKPVIDTLRKEGRIVDIDGEAPIDLVQAKIRETVRLRLNDPEMTMEISMLSIRARR